MAQEEEPRVPPIWPGANDEDLRCEESLVSRTPQVSLGPVPPVRALRDLALVRDGGRVLRNLLRAEKKSLPSAPDYFRFVQRAGEVSPSMRKVVAEWLLQVCQELQCQPEVFCLAMNYFDRFLSRLRVRKGVLQLIGSVCLLLASKFKESVPVQGERLIHFSDYSITADDIKVSEGMIFLPRRFSCFDEIRGIFYLRRAQLEWAGGAGAGGGGLNPRVQLMPPEHRTHAHPFFPPLVISDVAADLSLSDMLHEKGERF